MPVASLGLGRLCYTFPSDCPLYWREIWILLLAHKGKLGLQGAIKHQTWSCKGNTEECEEKHTEVLEKVVLPLTTNGPQYSPPKEYKKTWKEHFVGCMVLELSLAMACGLCTSPEAPMSTPALANIAGITMDKSHQAPSPPTDPWLPVTGTSCRRVPRRSHPALQLKLPPSQNQHKPNLWLSNLKDTFPAQ
ncbi:hypothetical protein WISP_51421 [Willisornis vidua]|uniref:Uncharacterized protein n=1 Tax=Willisornis vidua TaxID=1566151 RepID=A0ABQ9DDR0_9PASS|nr:hypothetical protein WISP_51421 [Willisornis vidua]